MTDHSGPLEHGTESMERVVVCRCEDVYLDEIQALGSLADGPLSAHELKLQTRAGMGICQGRTCGPALRSLLRGLPAALSEEDCAPSSSVPVRPLSILDLAHRTQLQEAPQDNPEQEGMRHAADH